MVIFPHPDDESMMTGGLLCFAHNLGIKTVVVTLTKGGSGKLFIHPKGKSTQEVRENELNCAIKCLGVDKLISGNFTDANLKNEEYKWRGWLSKKISEEKPEMVVTYDHSGLTGHPDHIVLSKVIFRLFHECKGLSLAQLYWVSLDDKLKKMFVPKEVSENFQAPTHVLDFGNAWINKWRAVKSHKSQRYAQIKITFPLWIFLSKYHFEWYHKVDLKKNYKVKYMKFNI